MPTFKYIGDEPSAETGDGEPVLVVHPDGAGESLRHFEPGDEAEARDNPDPARFELVEEDKPDVGPAAIGTGEVSSAGEVGTADV